MAVVEPCLAAELAVGLRSSGSTSPPDAEQARRCRARDRVRLYFRCGDAAVS
ncbi:MAG: hypothetical protein ACK58T_11855 [Phycisphaerae bacterium]|jgi:hypothetical protein